MQVGVLSSLADKIELDVSLSIILMRICVQHVRLYFIVCFSGCYGLVCNP